MCGWEGTGGRGLFVGGGGGGGGGEEMRDIITSACGKPRCIDFGCLLNLLEMCLRTFLEVVKVLGIIVSIWSLAVWQVLASSLWSWPFKGAGHTQSLTKSCRLDVMVSGRKTETSPTFCICGCQQLLLVLTLCHGGVFSHSSKQYRGICHGLQPSSKFSGRLVSRLTAQSS